MRSPLKPILMSVAACVLWGGSSVAQTTEQPNVVLMMVDNLGWGELGVYGGGELRGAATPRLDALAAEGMPNPDFDGITGNGHYADVLAEIDFRTGQVLDAISDLGVEDNSVRRTDNPVAAYNSISRALADSFVEEWKTVDPDVEIVVRDVGLTPPDFISNDWIASVFTAEEERTPEQNALISLSDTLIDELDRSDILLISTPMYNYGMPAALKAWFDQIIRINKTFTFDLARGDFPLEPIMSGKTLVLLTSAGEFGFEAGGIRYGSGHLSAHISTLRPYLGAERMFEAAAEYQEFADERHEASVASAQAQARHIARELA